jgi:hypothetical protein
MSVPALFEKEGPEEEIHEKKKAKRDEDEDWDGTVTAQPVKEEKMAEQKAPKPARRGRPGRPRRRPAVRAPPQLFLLSRSGQKR